MSARVGVSGNVYVYVFKENIVDELELLMQCKEQNQKN